jgi:hypothetical protein
MNLVINCTYVLEINTTESTVTKGCFLVVLKDDLTKHISQNEFLDIADMFNTCMLRTLEVYTYLPHCCCFTSFRRLIAEVVRRVWNARWKKTKISVVFIITSYLSTSYSSNYQN